MPCTVINFISRSRRMATSVTVLVLLVSGRFLRFLFFLGFIFSVTAPEGQYRLTEKPELEDLAVHQASDSFRSDD